MEGKYLAHSPIIPQLLMFTQSQLATLSSSSVDDISESDLKLGLLAYPVLQAADIMLYKWVSSP